MSDASFFISNQLRQGRWPDIIKDSIVHDLYDNWHSVDWGDTYFVLHMPAIGHYENVQIPSNVKKLIITCHTEPIDIEWLRELALADPERQICLLFDGLYAPPSPFYPANIKILPWLSWHFQIQRMIDAFGFRSHLEMPKFWASSLCNRSAQFKLYVTAYCVMQGYTDRMLISHHGIVDKPTDIDHLRTGHPLLDQLSDIIDALPIMTIDHTCRHQRDLPNAENRNWRYPQHTDCVFNFTNEGFHYSLKSTNHGEVVWPGPDLSEKTWKAILAGQAILPIGQFGTLKALQQLGLRFDYELDLTYDSIPGDLTRILQSFGVIDTIMNSSLDDLIDRTKSSCLDNLDWVASGNFAKQCKLINQTSLVYICDWLNL